MMTTSITCKIVVEFKLSWEWVSKAHSEANIYLESGGDEATVECFLDEDDGIAYAVRQLSDSCYIPANILQRALVKLLSDEPGVVEQKLEEV